MGDIEFLGLNRNTKKNICPEVGGSNIKWPIPTENSLFNETANFFPDNKRAPDFETLTNLELLLTALNRNQRNFEQFPVENRLVKSLYDNFKPVSPEIQVQNDTFGRSPSVAFPSSRRDAQALTKSELAKPQQQTASLPEGVNKNQLSHDAPKLVAMQLLNGEENKANPAYFYFFETPTGQRLVIRSTSPEQAQKYASPKYRENSEIRAAELDKQYELEEAQRQYGGFHSASRGMAHGILDGFDDEAAGFVSGAWTGTKNLFTKGRFDFDDMKKTYMSTRDDQRYAQYLAHLAHPYYYNTGDVAGNIAQTAALTAATGGGALAARTGIATGKVAANLGAGPKMISVAKAIGRALPTIPAEAANSAINAVGDDEDPVEAAKLGALIGPTASFGGETITSGLRKVPFIHDNIIKAKNFFNNSPNNAINKSLAKDGITPDQAIPLMKNSGSNATIMDISPSTAELGNRIFHTSGGAQKILSERLSQRSASADERLANEINKIQTRPPEATMETFDIGKKNRHMSIDELAQRRIEGIKPTIDDLDAEINLYQDIFRGDPIALQKVILGKNNENINYITRMYGKENTGRLLQAVDNEALYKRTHNKVIQDPISDKITQAKQVNSSSDENLIHFAADPALTNNMIEGSTSVLNNALEKITVINQDKRNELIARALTGDRQATINFMRQLQLQNKVSLDELNDVFQSLISVSADQLLNSDNI